MEDTKISTLPLVAKGRAHTNCGNALQGKNRCRKTCIRKRYRGETGAKRAGMEEHGGDAPFRNARRAPTPFYGSQTRFCPEPGRSMGGAWAASVPRLASPRPAPRCASRPRTKTGGRRSVIVTSRGTHFALTALHGARQFLQL